MGTLETILLTGAIIVIDVLVLKEYLKLEGELKKVKELAAQSGANLASIAQQVAETIPLATPLTASVAAAPLPEPYNANEVVIVEPTEKSGAERENEKLKAQNELMSYLKQQVHVQQLNEIESKINNVSESVKSAKEKITGGN